MRRNKVCHMTLNGAGLLLYLGLGLSGCGPTSFDKYAEQRDALWTQCQADFDAGRLKSHLALDKCKYEPLHQLASSNGATIDDWPIWDAYVARSYVIDRAWDQHRIADDEAKARLAEANARMQQLEDQKKAAEAAQQEEINSSLPVVCTTSSGRFGTSSTVCN